MKIRAAMIPAGLAISSALPILLKGKKMLKNFPSLLSLLVLN
jgi:hypothetical protein